MVWFKVDDGFYSSKKVLSIPRPQRLAAVGLWTLAGNWSGRELTDGHVPAYALAELGATPKLRQALIEARLWLDRGSGDIEFHDWARYQPTRAEVEANREKERIRKEKWRLSHGDTHGTDGGTPPGRGPESQQVSGDPDPTRPDPTNKNSSTKSSGTAKRGTRLTADFIVTPEMVAWAKEKAPLVNGKVATEKFINYWTAKSGATAVKLDWPATWRNWMLSDQERQETARSSEIIPAPRRVVSGRVRAS